MNRELAGSVQRKVNLKGIEQLIEQALVNMVKNAIKSIVTDGTITIITQLNPSYLIIQDDGAGRPKAIRQQLFTPLSALRE